MMPRRNPLFLASCEQKSVSHFVAKAKPHLSSPPLVVSSVRNSLALFILPMAVPATPITLEVGLYIAGIYRTFLSPPLCVDYFGLIR